MEFEIGKPPSTTLLDGGTGGNLMGFKEIVLKLRQMVAPTCSATPENTIDFKEVVLKGATDDLQHVEVVSEFTATQLQSMKRGVLFVCALWSGPARQGLVEFKRFAAKHRSGNLQIVILDTDGVQPIYELLDPRFQKLFGGWGEVLWIRDGKVVHAENNSKKRLTAEALNSRTEEYCQNV